MSSIPMEGPRMGKHEFYFYVVRGVADMLDGEKNNHSIIKHPFSNINYNGLPTVYWFGSVEPRLMQRTKATVIHSAKYSTFNLVEEAHPFTGLPRKKQREK